MKIKKFETTPLFEEIGDNIYRTKIPQPYYTDNNIYLIRDEEPVLIDSGYIENIGMLQKALRSVGMSLHKIRHIIYTHEHIDHMSAALTIRHYTNAKLYAMKGLADSVGNYLEYMKLFNRATTRLVYKAHNSPDVIAREMKKIDDEDRRFRERAARARKIEPDLYFDVELVEGDILRTGSRQLGFLHTPGHNKWHLTPYLLGEGIFFTGDLVLENISSIYAELDGNLNDYHRSLERLKKINIHRLLPAHGPEPDKPQRSIQLIAKSLGILERGVIRKLKEEKQDLAGLVHSAMGEKITKSGFYHTAIAIMHSMVMKLAAQGHVEILESDPPYEQYVWKETSAV